MGAAILGTGTIPLGFSISRSTSARLKGSSSPPPLSPLPKGVPPSAEAGVVFPIPKGVPDNPPAEDGSAPFSKGDAARPGVVPTCFFRIFSPIFHFAPAEYGVEEADSGIVVDCL